MTDCELLEAAAKAAGLSHPDGFYWITNPLGFQWNPLTDDGDALRLAVRLRLDILTEDDDDRMVATLLPSGQQGPTESIADDPYAATRRAIVRAAAEMAKEKT